MKNIAKIIFGIALLFFAYSVYTSCSILSQIEESAEKEMGYITDKQINNDYQSLLDVMKNCNSLISANELTFFFTLVVALLSVILFFKINEVQELKDENEKYKNRVNSFLAQTAKFNYLHSLIKSNYDLAIMIENIAMTLPPAGNRNVLSQIGSLRFRMNKNISHIRDRQENRETRMDSLTVEQRNLLNNYLGDTLEVMRRIRGQNAEVSRLVERTLNGIKRVEGIVNNMEIVKDDVGVEV